MAEKRSCSLCGEHLEDEPAIHDVVLCEKTELVKGRQTIKNLKASLDSWKDTWYDQRDIIGRLSWEHNNCPHDKAPAIEQPPNHWLHQLNSIVRVGNSVYLRVPTGWRLIGAGKETSAAEAVHRLMSRE
jgi:hypothetical protein